MRHLASSIDETVRHPLLPLRTRRPMSDRFAEAIQRLQMYWLALNELLPPRR
jgi:hypothetical protein